MPLDLFEKLEKVTDSVAITKLGDLRSEIDMDTTQSCAETGCGGPLGP